METRELRWINKTNWPAGPWHDEPDKVQWPDPGTGLPCLAKRHPEQGFWCGYVGVPPGHPCHGKDCNDVDVEVHGGLTYAAPCDESADGRGICHVAGLGEPVHVWWLGFDCAHACDYSPAPRPWTLRQGCKPFGEEYRDLGYVQDQCRQLAAQLAAKGVDA